MNPSVASYFVLLVTSVVFVGVALRKFQSCVDCPYPRDHKPAMMAIFVSLAWAVIALHGILFKWGNPYVTAIPIETPILLLLVSATLCTLLYAVSSLYKGRCYEAEPKKGTVFQAVCKTNHMGARKPNVRGHRPS